MFIMLTCGMIRGRTKESMLPDSISTANARCKADKEIEATKYDSSFARQYGCKFSHGGGVFVISIRSLLKEKHHSGRIMAEGGRIEGSNINNCSLVVIAIVNIDLKSKGQIEGINEIAMHLENQLPENCGEVVKRMVEEDDSAEKKK